MENLAHTLLGLSFAKAGLERATPLAATALVISSNLPDIDVLGRLQGGTVSYLEHHRGFTHGFVGLAVLAFALTLVLGILDRRFRLRRDPFRRPLRPFRIFLLAYLGGLGHSFMDFTNSYGIRPLRPFSNRWFYGDIAFVVDPWIWLILGSAVVWLTTTDAARTLFWLVVWIILSLVVGLALRYPTDTNPLTVPTAVRVIWFVGLAVIVAGTLMRWGRAGGLLARYSLLVLVFYYGAMWMTHQSALRRAQGSLKVDGIESIAVWPAPANPLLWQGAAKTSAAVFTGNIDLYNRGEQWRELPALDARLENAMRSSSEARSFLEFMRYGTANVEEGPDGATVVALRDLRFDLRMRVELDRELKVMNVDVRWF
ncbi:MAG TPA: metal-dependent hydrolase [Blastocatellia bacterium]|nr:metal-dependent hydrolase [Blastocatellia bacterium]